MDIETTTMSSRGQVVIPVEMRKNLKIGEKLVILDDGNQLIIKRASELTENFVKEFQRARNTDKILTKYETNQGKYVQMSDKDFLSELEEW